MYNELLKVFIEVADCGSFAKAADKLYLSSTAVMKQMNILEERLRLPLLLRTSRGVRLTEAGKSIYEDAKFMMQYSEAALERARRAQNACGHTIRVGSSALYPCKNLVDLWKRVSEEYPELRLKVIPFEDADTAEAFRNIGKKYDLLIGAYDPAAADGSCRILQLGRSGFGVAMPAAHRLAQKKSLAVADLYGETLMIMRPGNSPANDMIRREIEKEHRQIKIADAPQYYNLDVFNYCEEKSCLLLTLDCWKDIHPSLKTVPLDVAYSIPYGIVYAAEPDDGTKLFLNIVAAILQKETNAADAKA